MTEFLFPLYEKSTGKVICQICGKPFLVISPRHLKIQHNIHSYEEYTKRFPGAPLSTDEFKKRGSVGRKLKGVGIKEIFSEKVNPILKVNETQLEELEPEIEEIDIDKILKEFENDKKRSDPIGLVKLKILDHLKINFPNVVENYMIELTNNNGEIYRRYITDFADPVLRIDFEFPNAFWHNMDSYPDSLRDENLENRGWVVVQIDSASPTLEDVNQALLNYKQKSKDSVYK